MKRTGQHLAIATLVSVWICVASTGCTAPMPQRTFDTPDAAVQSLVNAIRAHDRSQLDGLFGRDAEELLSSGDEVADRAAGEEFVAAYDRQHRLVAGDDGSRTLVVGESDWPLPIPLVPAGDTGQWIFDTEAGIDELYNRRIGANELTVIEVIKAIADAQIEYAQLDVDRDGLPEYATKFFSDPGRKNGLYWETAANEPSSPLGEFVADAEEQGYSSDRPRNNKPRPYHGYFYRILTRQGPNAPGGAEDYMIKGKLIGGFAIIAWPAEYGSSGIMTFITNHEGTVYQKDLGERTDQQARRMTAYDPGPDWKKVD